MKPNPNSEYNKGFQQIKQDFQYVYFKDTEGRLKRLRKKIINRDKVIQDQNFFKNIIFGGRRKALIIKMLQCHCSQGKYLYEFRVTYAYFIYLCSMTWSQMSFKDKLNPDYHLLYNKINFNK